ncbi:unnamed protein product [Mucor hiemalis]
MNFRETLNDIELKSKGFPSSNITLSQKVYSDLVLAKKWKNVDYIPVAGLEICVFLANEPGTPLDNDKLVIVPIFQDTEKLSLKRIKEIFQSLSTNDKPITKFTFAIYASDSTIVYYHMNQGLVKPTQRNNNK